MESLLLLALVYSLGGAFTYYLFRADCPSAMKTEFFFGLQLCWPILLPFWDNEIIHEKLKLALEQQLKDFQDKSEE